MSQNSTYRVLVITDLGGDPDDIQSLVHLLHYSDIFKLEGIISTPGPGSVPDVEGIRKWVRHTDLDYLRSKGYTGLMSEDEVLAVVKKGAMVPHAPGEGLDTEGSNWIIQRAHLTGQEGTEDPLWVLVWGSMTDMAQALHDDPSIADKIRIYYIGSSNTEADVESRDYVYDGMKDKWPKLWWIENGLLPKFSRDTFRGYYEGGVQDGEWSCMNYIDYNIRGKGTTRGGMFADKLGDAFPTADFPKGSLKEGDTPTFLYLLSPIIGGIGNVEDPTAESWGGQFMKPFPAEHPNYYTDLKLPGHQCRMTIARWRTGFLGDWKKRWKWYEE